MKRRVTPLLVSGTLAAALLLAFAPKLLCLKQMAAGVPERHWCFSDIKALYDQRGFDVKAVPYADPPAGYPVAYIFEYPPGIGFPAYGLARLANTRLEFFLINALTLLLAAAVAAWALHRALASLNLPEWRLLLFAASPGLVVFGFHTWDLWSVAPAAAGLAAAASGRRRLAGVLFGLGAAVKWWPALLVLVLLFGPWARRASERPGRWSGWQRLSPGLLAMLTWAVLQLPATFVSPGNWWASMAFHFRRPPNPDGFYGVVRWAGRSLMPSWVWGEPFTYAVGIVGVVGLLAGVAYIATRLERHTLAPGDAALSLIVLFMLTSKVVSPQFILWLLPVAVISGVSWKRLLAVELPNAALWFSLAGQVIHLGLFRPLAVGRTLALAWVLVATLRTRSSNDASPVVQTAGQDGEGQNAADAGNPERLLLRPLRRLLTWAPQADGRMILLAAVAVYLTTIAAGRTAWGVDVWPLLGVPSGPSLFFDARNLTAAWECHRLGYDPLYESPCDPWGRPLMYLRPWLLLGVLGLGQSHTVALSVVLIAAMFLSFCLLIGRVPVGTGILLALAACSPAVMLAVERANMDIALFSLVAFSILSWGWWPNLSRVSSPVLMLLAATLKLYPVFALPAFLAARSRVAGRSALMCMSAFGIYVIYSLADVRHVAEIATQGQHFSYGARILIAHLYHHVGADTWAAPAAVKQLIALLPLGLIAIAVTVRFHRRLAPRGQPLTASPELLALHTGALIYLGTFAFANNFDYRLVFLLLTVPQLLEWIRSPAHPLSRLAAVTLLMILVLLWVGCLSEWLHLWDELASWVVAGLLAAVSAASMPRLNGIRGWFVDRPSGKGPITRAAS